MNRLLSLLSNAMLCFCGQHGCRNAHQTFLSFGVLKILCIHMKCASKTDIKTPSNLRFCIVFIPRFNVAYSLPHAMCPRLRTQNFKKFAIRVKLFVCLFCRLYISIFSYSCFSLFVLILHFHS